MTYESALRQYITANPGVNLQSREGQQAFNTWSGQTFGPGGFEAAPEPAAGPGATTVTGSNPTASNIFGSGDPTVGSDLDNIVRQAMAYATANPNQGQVSVSGQTGATTGSGTSSTAGTQTSTGKETGKTTTGGTTIGTTTGGSANQGTTTGTGTTTTGAKTGTTGTSTGTTATSVTDTLGLGGLLKKDVPGAQDATAKQRAFLTDLVANGPKAQQAQTALAVNQAMSGPGMVGAGDSARARAAGNAASNVGLNSLNQQLAASGQLSNDTALTNLVKAGNSFLGTSGTTTGATGSTGTTDTTGTTATTGTTNSVGSTSGATTGATTGTTESLNLKDLVNTSATTGKEDSTSTATANSAQAGIGNAPKDTTQQSGGCYACTAYADMGQIGHRSIRAAAQWKLSQPEYRRSLVGYSVYGPALARLILWSPVFAALFLSVARAVLHEELRLAGRVSRRRRWASLCHFIFDKGSLAIAVLTGAKRVQPCGERVMNLLKRNNLLMEVV